MTPYGKEGVWICISCLSSSNDKFIWWIQIHTLTLLIFRYVLYSLYPDSHSLFLLDKPYPSDPRNHWSRLYSFRAHFTDVVSQDRKLQLYQLIFTDCYQGAGNNSYLNTLKKSHREAKLIAVSSSRYLDHICHTEYVLEFTHLRFIYHIKVAGWLFRAIISFTSVVQILAQWQTSESFLVTSILI